MANDVQMAIRVDSVLRDEFSEAAAKADRNAGQVVRELMRDYVKRSREPGQVVAAPVMSDEARRKRQEGVNFARANVGLEGFKIDGSVEQLFSEYVDGKITIEDAINEFSDSIRA